MDIFWAWRLKEDGTIEPWKSASEVKVHARVYRNVMPMWITGHPTPQDFERWHNSIPGRHVDYLMMDRYDRMDDTMIVAILENEGVIQHGSYRKPPAYGPWSITTTTQAQDAGIRRKHKNGSEAWSFPESQPGSTGDWVRSEFFSPDAEKKRANYEKWVDVDY